MGGCATTAQVEMLTQHLGALEVEYDGLRDEFRAVTDDLEAMVKENQVWLLLQCSLLEAPDSSSFTSARNCLNSALTVSCYLGKL